MQQTTKGKNMMIALTENRHNGNKWDGIVSVNTMKKVESMQYAGGFKRYEIDIYEDNLKEKQSITDIKKLNKFIDNVLN